MLTRFLFMALAALVLAGPRPAAAEAGAVHIAEQPGPEYLPIRVLVAERLIEKRAKQAGLGDVAVVARRYESGIAVNQAIHSGAADIGGAGLTEMLSLWDRTRDTPFEARAVLALAAAPLAFVTADSRISGLADYDGQAGHRIAVPETRVSIHAVVLRMGAEKAFGPGQERKLDPLLVAMPATHAAALLSGGASAYTHVAALPHSFQEAATGPGRIIARSAEIVGGPHTTTVLVATQSWKEKNPRLFRAVAEAAVEALAWLDQDRARAARIYRQHAKSKQDITEIEAMFAAPDAVLFRPEPRNTIPFARFLERTGAIKAKAESWKDYFWESVHGLDGG